MQGASHHEAVSALRNAGSCIRMTVLRDRLPPQKVPDPDGPPDEWGETGQQPSHQAGQEAKAASMESTRGCLSKTTEAVFCNGNDIVGGLVEYERFSPYIMHNFYPLCFLPLCHSLNGRMR